MSIRKSLEDIPAIEHPVDKDHYSHTDDTATNTTTTTADNSPTSGAAPAAATSAASPPLSATAAAANGEKDEASDRHQDPNIVDWDGPNDPENPMNWPMSSKALSVGIVSTWTFLTPLASSMVAPGIGEVLQEFHSTSATLGSFIVSIYILGYAVGPLVIAPLSELYGRSPVYTGCNILFVIWTLACAFAPNLGGMLVFRFFQGMAGVCALTIGSGTISDVIPAERRGAFMSVYTLGPLLGPVAGPIAGAFLSEKEGWRWVFRVLTIAAGVLTVASFFVMRETYPPVLLRKKALRVRQETNNPLARSKLDTSLHQNPGQIFWHAILRPTKMLLFSPIVLLLSFYMAVVYGYLYLLFTTITSVYQEEYGWHNGIEGLSYLGIGIGLFIGLFLFAAFSDRSVTYLAKKHGTGRKPEYRLPMLMVGALFVPIGLFWYGWSAEKKLHYVMPIIGTGWVGTGLILSFMPISTYLVDSFTLYAASAMAANTVLRSLVGAFLPLAGPKMYQALGLGWGNSLMGFIAVALWPMSLFFYIYGERIRTSKLFMVEF